MSGIFVCSVAKSFIPLSYYFQFILEKTSLYYKLKLRYQCK